MYMDSSNLAVGDVGRGDISSLTSNTPIIKIDSIYIDLNEAIKKSDANTCEHFSIRGYVAEIQNKDRETCWPFHASCDAVDRSGMLPPMHIPRFRWWSCQNCLQEIESKDNEIVTNCCEEMKDIASNVINVHGIEHSIPLETNKNDNGVDVLNALIGGNNNIFADDSIKKILRPCRELSSCIKKHGGTCKETTKIGIDELVDSGFLKNLKDCSDNFLKKKQISLDDQQISNVVYIADNDSVDVSFHESDTEIGGIKQSSEGNSGDEEFLCKKSTKTRLLSDLFRENKFNISSKAMSRVSSFKGVKNQNCKNTVLPNEDCRPLHINSTKNLKKKPSFFNGDPKSTHVNNFAINNGHFKGNHVSAQSPIVYTDSISKETAPCGLYFSPGIQSQSAKLKVDENPIAPKMKTKMPRDGHKISSKYCDGKIGDSIKSNASADVLQSSSYSAFCGRKIDHTIGSEFTVKSAKVKSKSCKKKTMCIAEDGSTALSPLNNKLLNEGPESNGLHSSCKDRLAEYGGGGNYLMGQNNGLGLFMKQQKPSKEHSIRYKSMDSKHVGKGSENESFSLMHPKDLDNKNHGDLNEKLLEHGTSDDIPMEIVELMAKNQYERSFCPGGKDNPFTLTNPRSNTPGIINFSRVDSYNPAAFCLSNSAQNWRFNEDKAPKSYDAWCNKTQRFPDKDLCFESYHQRPNAFSLKNKGPMHSSETISAMHLLSLMDAGLQAHAAPGFDKIVAPSKETTSSCNGNPPREKCCHCFPSCSCGAENKKMDEFAGEASSMVPAKPKRGRPKKIVASANTKTGSPPKKKRGRPRKLLSTTSQNQGTSVSDLFPNQLEYNGSILETEICGMNQNPADFSMPIAGNVYTNLR